VQEITAVDTAAYDHFGNSVSISGDAMVIGASSDDDNGSESGSAYVYIAIDLCEGDFDTDGDVDGSDLAVFAADFGRTNCSGDCEGDFDNDNDVDGSDLATFAADFGRTDIMKVINNDPDMLEEYDFSKGLRGKYSNRYAAGSNVVVIDSDLSEFFPDNESVNQALRSIVDIIKKKEKKSAEQTGVS